MNHTETARLVLAVEKLAAQQERTAVALEKFLNLYDRANIIPRR